MGSALTSQTFLVSSFSSNNSTQGGAGGWFKTHHLLENTFLELSSEDCLGLYPSNV